MIYINLKGRIGNNLFQIAAACSLAKQLGVSFKAKITGYIVPKPDCSSLHNYLIPFRENILRKVDFVSDIPTDCDIYEEPYYQYHSLPKKDNIVLDGHFQSEAYFDEETVRDLFRIDPAMNQYIRTKYGNLLDKHPVSIVVRRGDYLQNALYYTVCTYSYYRRAIRLFSKNQPFLISSDDIAWCKKRFRGKQFSFIENESPTVSLYLQSMCSHHIISNSSFAWWGAWLNPNTNKRVIYPTPWFGPLFQDKERNDLIPDSWSPLPVFPHRWNKILDHWYWIFHEKAKNTWSQFRKTIASIIK